MNIEVKTDSIYNHTLWPNDAIWGHRSGSTLAQVMACCLTAPSHYLNQCWLIISKVLWHSSEDIIIRRFEDTNEKSKIEDYIFKITLRSPRGQWVNLICRGYSFLSYDSGNPVIASIDRISSNLTQFWLLCKELHYLKSCRFWYFCNWTANRIKLFHYSENLL